MKIGMKRAFVLGMAIFAHILLLAQNRASEFYVSSFKQLEMDLDARTLHPIIDQNGKKAALIKVVTTHTGFDFDIGVMGITEVHQEVGEIWVYIPEKAQRITIRHPEFGVIREYYFPVAIESATTYELRLKTPQSAEKSDPQRMVIEHKFAAQESIALPAGNTPSNATGKTTDNAAGNTAENTTAIAAGNGPTTAVAPVQEKGAVKESVKKGTGQKRIDYKGFLFLADIGINETPSYGIRAGYCRQIGGYLNIRSSFNNTKSNYGCMSDGTLEGGGTIWTTGKQKHGRLNATAGVMSYFITWLGAYAGAGYGTSSVVWEDINGEWAKVEDCSYKGVALDAGLLFTLRNFTLSAGINTVAFEWCEFTVGFGVRF